MTDFIRQQNKDMLTELIVMSKMQHGGTEPQYLTNLLAKACGGCM